MGGKTLKRQNARKVKEEAARAEARALKKAAAAAAAAARAAEPESESEAEAESDEEAPANVTQKAPDRVLDAIEEAPVRDLWSYTGAAQALKKRNLSAEDQTSLEEERVKRMKREKKKLIDRWVVCFVYETFTVAAAGSKVIDLP